MQRVAASDGRGSSTSSSAQSHSNGNALDVRDIDQKQLELRTAVEHRISTLERALLAREQQVSSLERQLRKLEEDYQYNYNLISERDRAIEEAAAYVVTLDNQLKQAQQEISIARQTIQRTEQQRDSVKEQLQHQQSNHDTKMVDVRRSIESMQRTHLQEIQAKETELMDLRENLQRAFATQRAEEDQAKSVSIAVLETALKEQSEASKRQEKAMVAEIGEWREKHDALRDALALTKQQLNASESALQAVSSETSRWERRLDDLSKEHDRVKQQLRAEEQNAKEHQMKVATLQAQLQEVTSQMHAAQTHAEQVEQRIGMMDASKDNQAARFEEACVTMRKNYELTIARMDDMQRQSEQKIHQMEAEVLRLESATTDQSAALERKNVEMHNLQEKLQDAERSLVRARGDVEKSKRDVVLLQERYDSEASSQEDQARKNAESSRSLSIKLRELEDQNQLQQQEHNRKLQASQVELNRVTRELQASEAARQALESQVSMLRDDAGLQYQLNRTLREKAELEQRVIELERVNESIRQQVNNFTAELQNDPVVKNARISAQQVTELSEQVKHLQGTVEDRDEALRRLRVEMRRYQDELLGAKEAQLGYHELSENHARMKQELAESRRMSAMALGTREADGDNRTVEALQEADFWRQRAKQLEASLRSSLEECDNAKRHEAEAVHALEALRSEKRSLTDVNNLLKAQLKQSYCDATAIAQSKAMLAPVLAHVPTNTMPLAVDKVAADQQSKLLQLEDTVAMLRDQISRPGKRGTSARPTASSEARSKSSSKQSISLENNNTAAASGGLAVEGSQVVRRRGTTAVRHYGVPMH